MNKWIIISLAIIVAILSFSLVGKSIEHDKYKEQIYKLNKSEQSYLEIVDEQGEMIVEQEQILLSQSDAVNLGLLEITRLKKVKSQVNIVTETRVDTFIVSHVDTVIEYFKGDAYLKLPQTYNYLNEHLLFSADIGHDGLKVNNISIINKSIITIGFKNNGLFRKNTPIVELKNSNPYVTTNGVGNVIIIEKESLMTNHKLWGGIGLVLGLIIK